MSNQLTTTQPNQFALSREMDNNTWNAIKEIYDGASDEKVALVIDYCKARKLDPLKKPVHIVPVWSNRRKMMVETLWPSVSEVRITAMRTGAFVRQDATVFGPDVTKRIGHVEMTFPEYAMVTVYRLVAGEAQAFHGPKCRWLETYSNRGKDDPSPNAMWTKRPYAQLEKCAEAAALRRAFPEEGSYTAEEMHGKDIDPDNDEPRNITEGDEQQQRPQPKERAKRGVAAAKAAEVVVPFEPAAPAPADDIQQAMKEREAKTVPVTPAEPAKAAPDPVPSNPAPAATARVFLQDGERLTVTAKVESVEAIAGTANGARFPAIKATLSGGFNGEVRQKEGGAKFLYDANKKETGVEALPPWKKGATLSFDLLGQKSTAPASSPLHGKVLVIVQSASEVQVTEDLG